jgi:2-polyprenyl-3-methyl-5-hydroxy-6-metoxy-1,4-benzoquinol methylase
VFRCIVCRTCQGDTFLISKGYSILRCSGCGLRFLNPQPTTAELADFYSREYFVSSDASEKGYSEYVADAHNHRKTFRNRIQYLPKRLEGARLLDVGAATGFFVEQARLAGWDAQGVEPSPWASEYARSVLGQPVMSGTLAEAAFAPKSFDVVTMWEVIEHLPDPRHVLEEVASILKPQGHLALSTPDAGSFIARVARRRWLGWRKVPEHLYFFDFRTLHRLLSEIGFEIVSRRYVSITVDAQFAFTRLMALAGVGGIRLPGFLGSRSVAVNPLYDLFLLARLTRSS